MWETVIVHFHYVTGLVFCADVCWIKVNQSVYTREMSFVYFVTAKGTHWDNLCNHHLPDLLSLAIQRRERIITVLWTLVKCLLYFVTYDLHRTASLVLSPYRVHSSWSFSSPRAPPPVPKIHHRLSLLPSPSSSPHFVLDSRPFDYSLYSAFPVSPLVSRRPTDEWLHNVWRDWSSRHYYSSRNLKWSEVSKVPTKSLSFSFQLRYEVKVYLSQVKILILFTSVLSIPITTFNFCHFDLN